MPDGTNNIYVDITFSTTSDGQEDVTTELTLADADVIGSFNMPVVYRAGETTPATQLASVEYYTTSGTTNGFVEQDTEYYTTPSLSGTYISLIDYDTGTIISGSLNEYIECFLAGDTGISGVPGITQGGQDTIIDYIVGEVFTELDINIQTIYWTWPSFSGIASFPTQYTHLPGINTGIEKPVYITLGSLTTMNSGTQTGYVDVEFAGWVDYPLAFDLYCALENVDDYINSELTVISGSVDFYLSDIMCATSGTNDLNIDIYCCLEAPLNIDSEITVIDGSIDKLDYDLYCSGQNINSVGFDVDLFSLKISNFSLAEDEYALVSEGISVDITDDMYSVLTSISGIPCSGTCCLKIDGEAVPVTFSGITDGYRMYYDSNDFSSLEGSTAFTVHAENSNGDILERDYYLTFGYLMDYDNIERIGFDYGINTQVVVRMAAENLATCPKSSTDAYWFETRDYSQKGLNASIIGELPDIISAEANLGASISPRSLAFFYGKTFRVVLSAKDFAGNRMEAYEFEFKIEDAP